jgi:arsenate reductase
MDTPIRVLVLCVGNSCRSQMAEALLERAGAGRLEVESAGIVASGVHPLTIRALDEVGIDWRGARSKPMDELIDERFDLVVTVCDEAREACPVFPGAARTIHESFADPALAVGTNEERMKAFRTVRDEIARWAESLAEELRPA